MVAIVVVSHSRALAREAVRLAEEMVPEGRRPPVEIAAGLDEDTFGTDAEAIGAAIEAVGAADGVLVLLDLGSAILSAELALEFLDEDVVRRVRLSPAPLVEGLIAAFVTASTGADLATVAADAENGLFAKREHLGAGPPGPLELEAADDPRPGEVAETWSAVLTAPHGLHARPAATLIQALQGFDADVRLADATNGRGPVPAVNLIMLATLDARQGHELSASITGPDAVAARDALRAWAEGGFGEAG